MAADDVTGAEGSGPEGPGARDSGAEGSGPEVAAKPKKKKKKSGSTSSAKVSAKKSSKASGSSKAGGKNKSGGKKKSDKASGKSTKAASSRAQSSVSRSRSAESSSADSRHESTLAARVARWSTDSPLAKMMARQERSSAKLLDTPSVRKRRREPKSFWPSIDMEAFGAWSERFARFMGTPKFLVQMTVFVLVWLSWNTLAPKVWQFDPRALNYTLLTLILSLQASYAAPLILLAQNRQDDRDRVALEQDRQQTQRALADTEYMAREVASLRLAVGDLATRDYLRSELREVLEEVRVLAEALQEATPHTQGEAAGAADSPEHSGDQLDTPQLRKTANTDSYFGDAKADGS